MRLTPKIAVLIQRQLHHIAGHDQGRLHIMSLSKSFHAVVRRHPVLKSIAYALLRTGRRIFWRLRPAAKGLEATPDNFLTFVCEHIKDLNFMLTEYGCGSGVLLMELARRYPSARFIGIDLQKAAIQKGKALVAKKALQDHVALCHGDICRR